MESHLLQMRGLKPTGTISIYLPCVASFTDAWIETRYVNHLGNKESSHLLQMRGLKLYPINCLTSHAVASFTDAWIET